MILRLAWMQSVLGFHQAPFLPRTAVIAIVACLEIIRRGIWNFFRYDTSKFGIKLIRKLAYQQYWAIVKFRNVFGIDTKLIKT